LYKKSSLVYGVFHLILVIYYYYYYYYFVSTIIYYIYNTVKLLRFVIYHLVLVNSYRSVYTFLDLLGSNICNRKFDGNILIKTKRGNIQPNVYQNTHGKRKHKYYSFALWRSILINDTFYIPTYYYRFIVTIPKWYYENTIILLNVQHIKRILYYLF